jgi:hypothetical protein
MPGKKGRRTAMADTQTVILQVAAAPRVDTITAPKGLNGKPQVTVMFPPCAQELLSLIKTTDVTDKDEVTKFFDEYFKLQRHQIMTGNVSGEIDKALLACMKDSSIGGNPDDVRNPNELRWPSECCICSPCVTLDGNRNPLPKREGLSDPVPALRRLFVGDLVWLFYFERLGIFQVLGVILDAFASSGRLPISNGVIDLGIRDDIAAVVLEVMVRQMKMGMSSTVRDRNGAYRTCLAWTSDVGRKLNMSSEINTGFNTQFHKFIYHALEFYKDKRLAVAIQGTVGGSARPSVATLITISATLDVLKKRFEAFDYGRNYYNTLSGIVWAIAGMSMIRELRTTLGIPPAYGDPHEYIPAAYDLLVLKRPVTHGETNRYIVHRECAQNARDILLDLEVIDHLAKNPGEELENWLNQIEAKVEGYRTAYRTLTGVDLGATGTPTIEQQV